MRLADELHDTGAVGDALWTQLAARWSADELVEAVCLAGFYHLVSYVCGALLGRAGAVGGDAAGLSPF